VPSPAFVVDLSCLRRNLSILDQVQERSGCRILLALKGFAMWSTFPVIRRHLAGVCTSGPWEAMLGREKFGGEVHVYAPAFSETDLEECLPLVDKISFNSVSQWRKFRRRVLACGRKIECCLRVNPECSTGQVPLYDPCVPGSRLGQLAAGIREDDLEGLSGLHFHTLCEQDSPDLERTLRAFDEKFGRIMERSQMTFLNMGGGHHITRPGYDIDLLVRLAQWASDRWQVQVYLEPGEAIAIRTGILTGTVLDLTHNAEDIAIVDVSATAHMPDTLEMPYRPDIRGAGMPGEKSRTYKLGGLTCLAGDVIDRYSFDEPLQVGDRLIFEDMSHYTMVKTTVFNGVKHPALCTWDPDTGEFKVVRTFRYEDYRDRLS
jgi:carboxynorspermidine decarboxylase